MPASHFEFHVEEPSMEAFLAAWLPNLLPQHCTFDIFPYPGKSALLRRLGSRLRGYAKWMPPEYRIVVVVDCDRDECEELKARLERICKSAGLRSRRAAGGPDWQVVTRIAIEELEAWLFRRLAGGARGLSARLGESSGSICSPWLRCDPRRDLGGIRTSPAAARLLQARIGQGAGGQRYRQTHRSGPQQVAQLRSVPRCNRRGGRMKVHAFLFRGATRMVGDPRTGHRLRPRHCPRYRRYRARGL